MRGDSVPGRPYLTRRRYSRRDFLRIGGAGLAGAALLGSTACGGNEGGGEGEKVIFTYGASGQFLSTAQELVDRFNQENEQGIQVELEQRSEVTDEYFRSIVSDFQVDAQPPVDVIAGDVIWGAEFAANGWIEDLSGRMYSDYPERVPDAFLDAPLDTVAYQNQLWGVPWFTDVGLLYYRQDLLDEAGLGDAPATWSGLRDIANQVKEEAGIQYGLVFQGADYEGGVVNGLEYIWNAGGQVLSGNISTSAPGTPVVLDPNFVAIDNPSSIQGLRTERSMVTDDIAPRKVADFTESDSRDAFKAGNAVFMRGWPAAYAVFDTDDSQVSQDQVGIATLPTEEEGLKSWGCLGGWNMYMNAASQQKDAAWEFIKWITAPGQQKELALKISTLPTLNSLYEDQEVLNQLPVVDLVKDFVRDSARSRPVTPYYSIISRRLATGFHNSLTGQTEPQQVIQNLQSELTNIVSQRG